MTCIVGIETDQGIIIGADSMSKADDEIDVTSLKKVFKRGDFIIGYTSSFRMGQILQYKLDIPANDDGMDDMEYMCTYFIDSVRNAFKDNGYLKVESNEETGGCFFVGFNNKLYCVHSDFQVNRSAKGYDAIGCGAVAARAALFVLSKNTEMKPHEKIMLALDAASDTSSGVCKPYVICSDNKDLILED